MHREPRLGRTAGHVEVHRHRRGGVVGLEVEHHGDHVVRVVVVDALAQEDDALAVHPVVDVDPLSPLRSRDPVCHLGDADGHHLEVTAGGAAGRERYLGEVPDRLGHGSHDDQGYHRKEDTTLPLHSDP